MFCLVFFWTHTTRQWIEFKHWIAVKLNYNLMWKKRRRKSFKLIKTNLIHFIIIIIIIIYTKYKLFNCRNLIRNIHVHYKQNKMNSMMKQFMDFNNYCKMMKFIRYFENLFFLCVCVLVQTNINLLFFRFYGMNAIQIVV